jgi:hypothetical protein
MTCCAVALALSLAPPMEAKRTKPWKTPHGQAKKGRTAPPGLAKKNGLPPGLYKKGIVGDTSGVQVVNTTTGTTYRRGSGRRLTR